MPILPAFSIDDTVFGTAQADTLSGGTGSDLIYGGAGGDTISGRGGDDLIYGGRGGDTIAGNQGADTAVWTNGDGSDAFDGGTGSDLQLIEGSDNSEQFSLGTSGGDALFQRTGTGSFQIGLERVETVELQSLGGDDRLTVGDLSGTPVGQVEFSGGDGTDRLQAQGTDVPVRADGGTGGDLLTGGSGGDQLFGDSGGDTLRGNGGSDWLAGGSNSDLLVGGRGDDVLEGGTGNDRLSGGTGDDAYVFQPGDGNDTILGFGSGDDQIVMKGFTVQGGGALSFNDVTPVLTEQGGDTTIDLSGLGGGSITVDNATGLTANDFVFL